jgi:endogenous inhibitor of DNA gyrase (YacG/DUF329 family)
MDEKARENNRLRQRKFLKIHKEEVNARRRERYQERLSLGKCPRCGGRVKKGRTLCADCCEYMLDLNRKYAGQKKSAVKAKAKAKPAARAKAAVKVKAKPKAKATVKARPAVKARPKAKAKKR